jgi:phenylacetate-CoA ligase
MTNLYSLLDRKIFFPIADNLNNSNIIKYFSLLEKTDWYSEKQLTDLQNEMLFKLVKHSYEQVPYYNKLFSDYGLLPQDVTSRQDLKKIPILSKQDVRDNYNDLISKDINSRRTKYHSTGGSTGVPLQFQTDMNTWSISWASSFRAWKWYGFNFGEKIFTIGGNSLVSKKNKISKKNLFEKYLLRNFKFHSAEMQEFDMQRHYKNMMKLRPNSIRGYASTLYVLAKYIRKKKLKAPNIKVILTTGEILLPQYRSFLQEVFQAPVFDEYGAGDGGVGSHECYMHEGLHITEERCVIEICNERGEVLIDNEVGNVITTDLYNYAFPFIRYQVGDKAYIKKDKCSCGRSSRLFGEIMGRNGKLLFSKKGVPISPTMLPIMLYPDLDFHNKNNQIIYNKIDRFQIQQDEKGDLAIFLKMKDKKDEDLNTFNYLKTNYKHYFPGSEIIIKFVTKIDSLPSGKEDFVISKYQYNEEV